MTPTAAAVTKRPAEGEEASTDDEASATTEDGDDGSDSDTLAIVALIVGGLGVVLGGLALIRRRTP